MNERPTNDPELDSSDRFIDATLRESARLGKSKRDEALVARILTETVQRPNRLETLPAHAQFDRRLWITGATAAAALIALLATLLAVLPFRGKRNSEEILLVVRYGVPQASDVQSTLAPKSPPTIAPRPYEGIVDLVTTPESVPSPLLITQENLHLTTVFGQSIEEIPPRPMRQDSFRIVADETSEQNGIRHYEGNVSLRYEDFTIEADSVDVVVATEDSMPASGMLTAYQVQVTQGYPARFAAATRMEFDPRDGSLILVGVTEFRTNAGDLSSFAETDQLVLKQDSFAVQKAAEGYLQEIKYANPLPLLPKRK